MPHQRRYLRAEIDPAAIAHNLNLLRQFTPQHCKICVAVKCNAYGHGIDLVLPVLKAERVDMLAVATIAEARQLRAHRWTGPILLLGSEISVYQGREKDEMARWLVEQEIRITPMCRQDIDALTRAAGQLKKKAVIHLKVDTGMCRMGLVEQTVLELMEQVAPCGEVYLEGLYTHFATADESDKSFTYVQLRRFTDFLGRLAQQGLEIPIVHAANSAATIDVPESHYDMIRPGISVYGYHAGPEMHHRPGLKPALKVVSHLIAVKRIDPGNHVGYGCTWQAQEETILGLVPIGYGDGYSRQLSNRARMRIAQQLVSVIGRISMDVTVVNLTAVVQQGIKVFAGQEIEVFDDDPQAVNSVASTASLLQTIPYEIVTQLGQRVTRVLSPNVKTAN